MADQAENEKTEGQGQALYPIPAGGRRVQIRVKGQLSRDWADWLEGLEMTGLENGEMLLSGMLADQSALMGVLAKLHRLNLTILSVN
jgi:hypothetical protein